MAHESCTATAVNSQHVTIPSEWTASPGLAIAHEHEIEHEHAALRELRFLGYRSPA
jgi:hypothetical protein